MPGVLAATSSKPLKQSVIIIFPTSFWCLSRAFEGSLRALRSSIVAKMRLPRSTLVLMTRCVAESRDNDVHRTKVHTLFFRALFQPFKDASDSCRKPFTG